MVAEIRLRMKIFWHRTLPHTFSERMMKHRERERERTAMAMAVAHTRVHDVYERPVCLSASTKLWLCMQVNEREKERTSERTK